MTDNRSRVRVASAVGSAKNFDYNLLRGAYGGVAGGAGALPVRPRARVLMASFADSYDQMVRALRYYRTQNVKGGLGTGGGLKVGN